MPLGPELARTAAFTGMVVFEKVSMFAVRSLTPPNGRIGWLCNPFLIVALSVGIGLQVLAVSKPPLQALLKTVAPGAAR